MRFHEYHDLIKSGGYPRIHDRIKSFIDLNDIKGKVVLDAGACTGSLGLWAAAQGAALTIIEDRDVTYIERAKQYADVHAQLHNFHRESISFQLAPVDMTYAMRYRVDTVLARRFIYLLRTEDVQRHYALTLRAAGVKNIYLQGLVPVKNHREPLWNVELEAQIFIEAGYSITIDNKDIIKLEL